MAEKPDLKIVAKRHLVAARFQATGCIVAMLSIAQFAICQDETARQSDDSAAHVRERPVVRWTADRDEMNFRYDISRERKDHYIAPRHAGDGDVQSSRPCHPFQRRLLMPSGTHRSLYPNWKHSSEEDDCHHRQASLGSFGPDICLAQWGNYRRTAGDEHCPLPHRRPRLDGPGMPGKHVLPDAEHRPVGPRGCPVHGCRLGLRGLFADPRGDLDGKVPGAAIADRLVAVGPLGSEGIFTFGVL